MSWFKEMIRTWLGVREVDQCSHQWVTVSTKHYETKNLTYKQGSYTLTRSPNQIDTVPQVLIVHKCTKCGLHKIVRSDADF